jgi:large repetitive protein
LRLAISVVILALLAGMLSGCLFVNQAPVADITASILSGRSPLLVEFDASDSYDLDGTIVSYEWDFDDGSTDDGVTTTNTFTSTTARTYTVTLTVTDNSGATAITTQSIEVLPAQSTGANPPTARFTASPSYGNSPLTVEFDATLSYSTDSSISVYAWDFGDGATGGGRTIAHVFTAQATENVTITLTVTDKKGSSASTSLVVTVMVPINVPTDGPTASFTKSDPVTVYESDSLPSTPSLFEVAFNPQLSSAASGHTIEAYLWNFGDGETLSATSDAEVKHTYASAAASHVFVVTLTVVDDQGLSDSTTGNVTVTNNP